MNSRWTISCLSVGSVGELITQASPAPIASQGVPPANSAPAHHPAPPRPLAHGGYRLTAKLLHCFTASLRPISLLPATRFLYTRFPLLVHLCTQTRCFFASLHICFTGNSIQLSLAAAVCMVSDVMSSMNHCLTALLLPGKDGIWFWVCPPKQNHL